jgi:hypothetical protein
MKNALRLIIVVSVLWLVGLATLLSSAGGHVALDRVLPPSVLDATTPEERIFIAERLAKRSRPTLAWIPPVCTLVLASYTLFAASRRQ